MSMNFSPRVRYAIEQLKTNIKLVVVGLLLLAMLSLGFAVAVVFFLGVIIAIPVLRWWAARQATEQHEIDDFIDVEYRIVETKTEDKEEKK